MLHILNTNLLLIMSIILLGIFRLWSNKIVYLPYYISDFGRGGGNGEPMIGVGRDNTVGASIFGWIGLKIILPGF
jgi:hypothetical protein